MISIKVCGFQQPEQAAAAIQLGADFAGIVLWSGSPRGVTDTGQARALRDYVRAAGGSSVGVFVDTGPGQIRTHCESLALDVAQIQAPLGEDALAGLVADGLRIWRVLEPGADGRSDAERSWAAGAEAVLLDGRHPHLRGGTGQRADWTHAAELAAHGPLVLAGGLGPSNVAAAIEAASPWAVDASTALESSPGDKDLLAVRHFVHAVRAGACGGGGTQAPEGGR